MSGDSDWLEVAKRACQNKEAFEHHYSDLNGKIKQLLKHRDPRAKSQRNTDKDWQKMSPEEQQIFEKLLKLFQSFPMKHKFSQSRHQSKYRGKAKNMNHLISSQEIREYDKRNQS